MKLDINKYSEKMKHIQLNTSLKMGMVLILGMLLGNLFFSGERISVDTHNDHADHQGETTWTCSMHPQVKLDEPGQCPICFMDLIPLESNDVSENASEITLSDAAVKLASISTTPVRHGVAQSDFYLSGKIDYDETRIKNIAAWFPGRLEHLYVDYTGIRVNKGDHLLEIYSPELYSTQSELLQAYIRVQKSEQSPKSLAAAKATYEAVHEKTKLLGLSNTQINAITSSGKPRSVLQINSPITGVVIHKNAVEGKYVKTGEQIYSIADLSKVWLNLEAYEKDLPWLTYGQKLTFTVAGLPGQVFSAHISYIDPLVNAQKRSVTVRAVLDNDQGSLKPGMLAEASIAVTLNGEGHVVTPDLTGKWACPMHPEVVEDHPSDCSVCGMDLVPLEEIGGIQAVPSHALLIPASSVLKTGRRALVYIKTNQTKSNQFALREIVLGPRVGQEYIVLGGLSMGELVVSNGNFKIDSAMQIAGKPSMMSGDQSNPSPAPMGHNHG